MIVRISSERSSAFIKVPLQVTKTNRAASSTIVSRINEGRDICSVEDHDGPERWCTLRLKRTERINDQPHRY